MKNIKLTIISLLTSGLAASVASFASTPAPPARVTAWGMHYGGQVIYKYQVQNVGEETINRFLVGHNPSETQGGAELSVRPKRNPANPSFWLSSQVAERPNGWGVRVVYPEESETFSIEWIEGNYFNEMWPKAPHSAEAPADGQAKNGLLPNTTWNNFSVNVPTIDTAYVKGHATISYGDELITLPILKGDAVAPNIDLIVKRVNQDEGNGNWAIFHIRASAKDNYDPFPTLDFAPITSNQVFPKSDVIIGKNDKDQLLADDDIVTSKNKNAWTVKLRNRPNRTYQMKVTSEDASGNLAVKTFDYAVSPK